MSHIRTHGIHPLVMFSPLVGLAVVLVSLFCRVALGIGIVVIFTTALTVASLVGIIVGPLATCTVACSRVVVRRWVNRAKAEAPLDEL